MIISYNLRSTTISDHSTMEKPTPTHLVSATTGTDRTTFSARRSVLDYVPRWIGVFAFGLAAGTMPARAVETANFEIVARDGRLFPERLEVPAGVRLRLSLRNEGKAPVEFENLELRVEKVLAPDAAAVVLVLPLKPGNYTFIDDFHADTGKMLLIAK